MNASVGLALVALAAPASGGAAVAVPAAAEVRVTLEAPRTWVPGSPFVARLELYGARDAAVPAWMLTPGAFEADGRELAQRAAHGEIPLAPADRIVAELDLSELLPDDEFTLTCGGEEPVAVDVLLPAPKSIDFMELPAEGLAGWRVHLATNRGNMLFELWHDVAPSHVRNFLDLAHTGFYDGTTFHRVHPGFMIQGGDPGAGHGPRTLALEPSDRTHARGVLSMARSQDPDSASCQFFVVHADSPHLDGQYTAFGRLVAGLDTLDAIALAPGRPRSAAGDVTPVEDQIIERAHAVRAE